jgi:hypothetical protein
MPRSTIRTTGEVIKLVTLKAQRSLVTEQVCIVQGGLIHELQSLRNEENGKYDEIDLPADPGIL